MVPGVQPCRIDSGERRAAESIRVLVACSAVTPTHDVLVAQWSGVTIGEEDIMRAIRRLFMLVVLAVAAVLAYNYWTGNGWTLTPPSRSATGIDAEKARETGAAITRKAAETTKVVAERTGVVMSEATLTAKIKSKMALDDHVKARNINVDTTGTVVTLTGTVHSEEERQRAARLARETEGITQVVDRLQVAK
jgi:hypothetical protein